LSNCSQLRNEYIVKEYPMLYLKKMRGAAYFLYIIIYNSLILKIISIKACTIIFSACHSVNCLSVTPLYTSYPNPLIDLKKNNNISRSVLEFIDPRLRENKPKTLLFSHGKRAFWACICENWVYNFGHRGRSLNSGYNTEYTN
jgi:hypothetical protein